MRIKPRLSSILILVIATSLLGEAGTAKAQTSASRYFPATGHWVTGAFLDAYESVSDPLKIYGEPITDAFLKKELNQQVQYFQKALFVLNSDPSATQPILIYPLGWLLPHAEFQPAPPVSGCQFFSETGFQVCYTFLDFFNEYGGVAQFGFPISNFEMEAGRIVQYFQRSRFEWHPELPYGQKVLLSDLGLEYFKYIHEDPQYLLPDPPTGNILQSILQLQIQVYAGTPVLAQQGEQRLYIIVQDQNKRPVANASLNCSLRLPGEQPVDLPLLVTNANGIASLIFNIKAHNNGIAEVFVTATFDSYQGKTKTSFWIWW